MSQNCKIAPDAFDLKNRAQFCDVIKEAWFQSGIGSCHGQQLILGNIAPGGSIDQWESSIPESRVKKNVMPFVWVTIYS